MAARMLVRLWAAGLPAVNAARAAHGLDPLHDPIEIFAEWDRVLVLSSAGLEPRYAEGARRIAATMAEEAREDLAVAELEALAPAAYPGRHA